MKKNLQKNYDRKALGAFLVIALLLFGSISFGQTVSVTISASGSWTPPAGVTSIQVEAWGGGGGGGGSTSSAGRAGGGGAGGGYVKHTNVAVTNQSYAITVGSGGIAGASTNTANTTTGGNGGPTSATFGSLTVTAVGGNGGIGNTINSAATIAGFTTGQGGPAVLTGNSAGASLSFYGGSGAAGVPSTRSGGGGGAAGELSNGGTASASAVTGGSYGGANVSPYGTGANGNSTTIGTVGNLPGGGGSGGYSTSTTGRAGGTGRLGQVIITYTPTTPTITLSASILTGFAISTNSVSSTKTINVSGANLTTDIIISPSTNFEISISSTSGFGSSITIPFGTGTVADTPIYVRVKSGATAGLLSEAVTFTSDLTPTQSLTCSGTVVTNYYYKGNSGTGSLATLSNWGTISDGTGTNPPDFGSTTNYQSFIITNAASVTTNTSWTIGAVATSVTKLILGDSSKSAVSLTISSGFPITLGTNVKLDLAAASSGSNEIIFQDATLPTLGTIDPSANITYATSVASGITGTACNTLKIANNTPIALITSPNCKFLVVDSGSSITATSNFIITISTGGNVVIDGSVTGARSQGIFTTDASAKGTIYGVDVNTPITLGTNSTVIYNRTTSQTISLLTYANLEIQCPAVVLNTDITVNNNLTVGLLGNVTVSAGKNLTVKNALINNATAGASAVIVENGANLIQVNNVANTNAITVKRNSNALFRSDYSLWSSPVMSQKLLDFSPATTTTRFYSYNTTFGTNGAYSAISSPSTTNFISGNGYLIRMPNTNPLTDYDTSIAALAYPGVFTGVAINGDVSVALTDGLAAGLRYNLVGNPYPSPIAIATFLSDNTLNIESTLYFWRKTNGLGTAYCTWVPGGPTGTFTTNGNVQSVDPLGIIQTGQGFFVEAKSGATTLTFKNTQRTANIANQFFRTKQVAAASKIWLNATNTLGNFSQMAVTYFADATLGLDTFDGKYINDSAFALTSNINNVEYTIQGRPAFDAGDVVALNFKTDVAGDYTIALDHFDGLFATGQDIYLVDSKTGAETNLKLASYTFTATTGTDNARFSLKYQKILKVDAPVFNDNSVSVYKNNGTLYVNSGAVAIRNISVFDVQGRLIAEQKNVKATTAAIKDLRAIHQVLIVKISGDDNSLVTKKVVN